MKVKHEIVAVELVEGGLAGITFSDETSVLLSAHHITMLGLPTYEVLDADDDPVSDLYNCPLISDSSSSVVSCVHSPPKRLCKKTEHARRAARLA